jgi:Glycosyltransferase family 87
MSGVLRPPVSARRAAYRSRGEMNLEMEKVALNRMTRRMFPAVEWVLLLALLWLFVGRALVPGWRILNTDFPNYYLAAVLRHQRHLSDRTYDWIWFQRQKDHNGISQPLVGFVPNPPLCAAPMLLLASLPALPAKRVWMLLNLSFLVAALCILHRVTQLRWRHIFLIAGLCILPLRTNFTLGQYYIVILLLICLAYSALVRGHHFSAGGLLATAAWFKLFPAVFLLLFLRKRDWRGVSGLILGSLALGIFSVIIFGLDIHRVWLFEVLPRAFRGDMVGPYDLQWSSFSALWHRLFLFEPELNPAPLLSSPSLYALIQVITSTTLLFAFLFSTGGSSSEQTTAWEWATFIPLLLLLSSMPGSYHYAVLIFTVIIGTDVLIKMGRWRAVWLLLLFYVIACAPLPGSGVFLLRRLLATIGLYIVLLYNAPAVAGARARKTLWAMAGVVSCTLLAISLSSLKNRDEDFSRRLSNINKGYASFNPVATSRGVASIEMVDRGYRAVMTSDGSVVPVFAPNDILSMAASAEFPYIYFEMVDRGSHIMRLRSDQVSRPNALPQYVTEGQQPSLSYDGHWLAFLREDRGQITIWRSRDGGDPEQFRTAAKLSDVLELSVTTEGDIIAALGSVASPRLVLLRAATGEEKSLDEIAGAVRYPAVSPDSGRLALSRRESGSWHLFVRDFSTGAEQRLTTGACNATSPTWEDSHTLLYATDCGRGYELNAVARIALNK